MPLLHVPAVPPRYAAEGRSRMYAHLLKALTASNTRRSRVTQGSLRRTHKSTTDDIRHPNPLYLSKPPLFITQVLSKSVCEHNEESSRKRVPPHYPSHDIVQNRVERFALAAWLANNLPS